MTVIENSLIVPYDRAAVLGQFFDFEHVRHVHPRTLGDVTVRTLGDGFAVGDVRWPSFAGIRLRSGFRQRFEPPARVRVDVIDGFGRGTTYVAELAPEGNGTAIRETLTLPRWIPRWASRRLQERMNRVWREDLRAGLCRGGWPGLAATGIDARLA